MISTHLLLTHHRREARASVQVDPVARDPVPSHTEDQCNMRDRGDGQLNQSNREGGAEPKQSLRVITSSLAYPPRPFESQHLNRSANYHPVDPAAELK